MSVCFVAGLGVWLWQCGWWVQAQRSHVLIQEPQTRAVDHGGKPSLQLLPFLHVCEHHGPQQPQKVSLSVFQMQHVGRGCALAPQCGECTCVPLRRFLQGARTKHLPVPTPLWRSWINHAFGLRLRHVWQHCARTELEEGTSELFFLKLTVVNKVSWDRAAVWKQPYWETE